jgi:hypothetical protein
MIFAPFGTKIPLPAGTCQEYNSALMLLGRI